MSSTEPSLRSVKYFNQSRTYMKTHEYGYSWTIQNFSDWLVEVDERVQRSPAFPDKAATKYRWKLLFIPKKLIKDTTYCSLYLRLVDAPKDVVNVRFKFCMRNDAGVKFGKRGCFEKVLLTKNSPAVGLPDFITQKQLLENLSNDVLIISCKIEIAAEVVTEKEAGTINQAVSGNDLSSNMAHLLNGEKFGDATIIAGERKFLVYKGILAARSPVFAAMFNHDLVENTQNTVNISDVEEEIFQELLRYIYTDKVANLGKFAYKLFAAADKYSILPLKTLCQQSILANLSIYNAAKTLLLADMHQAEEIKARVVQFLGSAASRGVTGTADWKATANTHPRLLLDAFEAVDSRMVNAKVPPN